MSKLKSSLNHPLIFLMLSFLFACNPAEKRWKTVKLSDSIPTYISFIKEFPNNSYGDSAILKVEKKLYTLSLKNDSLGSFERYNEFINMYPNVQNLIDVNSRIDSILIQREKIIFLLSTESITRNETFKFYEEFVIKYPKIKNIIDADKKLEFLKQKADTVVIRGKLVNRLSSPISKANIVFYSWSDRGTYSMTVGDNGVISNPRTKSESAGDFKIFFHRSYIKEHTKFILEVNGNFLEIKMGKPVVFKIENTNRVTNIGNIISK